ncbi:MAG: hypothetical protein HOP02_04780 [Methylococcaceae bacterium]|nr:hypothetical protein [Methylococcaceae bacterium]
MKINPTDLSAAQQYIQRQFDTRSWWPKEQPDLAQQEFHQMQADAAALDVWCERWLDAGQCRKLEKSITGK